VSDEPLLTVEILRAAFVDLDRRLQRRRLTADVFVFGGAAMVLGFDARPATRDVDAIWQPHTAVLEEAWAVAADRGLPRSWLNEQASSYMPAGVRSGDAIAYHGAALRVTLASAELLLAMKVRAARRGDLADISLLAERLGLAAAPEVLALAESVFGEPVRDRQRMAVEDLFDRS
jgi:Nucleotidyltransferase of unknown function (DUF6036)